MYPLPIVGEQGGQILPEAVGHKEWGTVGGQHVRDVVDHTLRHHQGPLPDVNRQQQLALGRHRYPDPVGRTRQTFDRLVLTDCAVLEGTEYGVQLVELHLGEMEVAQEILRKGPQLVGRLD